MSVCLQMKDKYLDIVVCDVILKDVLFQNNKSSDSHPAYANHVQAYNENSNHESNSPIRTFQHWVNSIIILY